ncbi:hypothetical protein B0H15DRAFT_806236 [Mycena belliarum]|uniref:Uncharacterized protein n=1 Tax=Mycena belliarum TaxID=1033014 RepID=A0AAD6TPG2_9AGAR|nr:hypothetical protein B0H15DRAFT_806236 [Mycena belliae]
MLYAAISALKRPDDDLTFSFLPRNDCYTSTTLDIDGMTYSIPKSQFKDMALTCDADYQALLKEATKKTAPETIKIFLTELKSHEEGDEDEVDSSDDERPRKKKKKKTFEPSAEEVEQNDLIVKLNSE